MPRSLEDGTIIFSDSSDPAFTALDKAGPPQLPGNIYALSPGGAVRVLVDGYDLIAPTTGARLPPWLDGPVQRCADSSATAGDRARHMRPVQDWPA